MKKVNTKPSVKKKLIPAAGSLLISAAMLSTSTYAWFTMSREVEVKGLKMTATVPEDLQISVGDITAGKYLNDIDSFLTSNGTAAPTEENMWSNIVDMSQYYNFGRLIPASSINGEDIFFTPDATKQGKDIKESAKFYQATDNLTASGTYMATLHVREGDDDEWGAPSGSGYDPAESWSVTNDDGYYVDVPVWIRSSSESDITISVDAYVKPGANSVAGDATGAEVELYRATRVAILNTDGTTHNLINMIDGSGTGWLGTRDVVDYYGSGAAHGVVNGAVKAAGDAGGSDDPEVGSAGDFSDIYGPAEMYDKSDASTASVATIAGSSGQGYGTPTMLWIRVWLEGEDPECWNQNAGQDWDISLKFEKI